MIRKIILLLFFITTVGYGSEFNVTVKKPLIIIQHIPVELQFQLIDNNFQSLTNDTSIVIHGLKQKINKSISRIDTLNFIGGLCKIENIIFSQSGKNTAEIPTLNNQIDFRVIPGWLTVLPPFAAILLALIARQVLVALFVGVWIGAFVIYDYNPVTGFFYGLTEYIARAPADTDKMAIIVFSLVLGGMVGVISKMGGIQGIVERLSRYASNSRRGQIVTWLMGVFIFFDDYANTLIVGNTMRPLTDKLRISREKLSYLVDSTAAPVANIAIISTWIGFEIGLIATAFHALGLSDNAYITFFKTIPFNFYPIFALIIGISVAWFGRDFGPMLKAERRATKTGQVLAVGATPISSLDSGDIIASEDVPKRWFNGFIPIFVVILTTLVGLWITGINELNAQNINTNKMGFIHYVSTVIGLSDSYAVLMWAAFLGSVFAILLSVSQKLLTLEQSIAAWVGGIKAMLMAALILTMAWSIGNICTDLHTADYVIYISEDYLSPHYIPLLSFLISAIISFATGTSWGVMAILMPIVIPIGYLLPQTDPSITLVQQQSIFLSTIASVLAGATFGDHCSPISDTTIMSSMATGADHIDHVRTQLPYALLGGIISIMVGYLPIGFGISNYIVLPVGILLIILFVRFFGKKVTD